MKSEAETVDQYMAELPDDRRGALATIRALIKEVAPQATESMQHGMPFYELDGYLFAFASQKHAMSLYVQEKALDEFRPRLAGLDLGKSCIRFRHIERVPLDVVKEVLEAAVKRHAQAGEQA